MHNPTINMLSHFA